MMTVAQAVHWCDGQLHGDGGLDISGVYIDSRKIRAGGLFVCLPGLKVDGHDFVSAAAVAGATCALVERVQESTIAQIVVDNCADALRRLAAAWRARFKSLSVTAITGSNGKTTVKEMLAAICRAGWGDDAVCQNEGNLNNLLGLPLTLLRLRCHHRVAVLEAGMDAHGELEKLGRLAGAQTALINNAQRAHLGGFNSLREIAEEKGELLKTLPADGVAVLNAQDPHFTLWKEIAGKRRVFSFGASENANCRALARDGKIIFANEKPLEFSLLGRHNALNALAAAACAKVLGLSLDTVRAGLKNFVGVPRRSQHKKLANGALLIDDTYNANPDSVLAALQMLFARPGKRVAILGDMLALGKFADEEHGKIIARVMGQKRPVIPVKRPGERLMNPVLLLTYGECMGSIAAKGNAVDKNRWRHFSEKSALIDFARHTIAAEAGKISVLVKGSRGMAMEEVADALEKPL